MHLCLQDGEEAVSNKLTELEAAGSQLKAELLSLTRYVYILMLYSCTDTKFGITISIILCKLKQAKTSKCC